MKKILAVLIVVILVFGTIISVIAEEENTNETAKLSDTQEFFEAINQWISEENLEVVPAFSQYDNLVNKNNKENIIKIFEETDERVIFTINTIYSITCSETIDEYEFFDPYFGKSDLSERTGYSVYQNGRLYRIADAVKEEITTVEYLAELFSPYTQKLYESDVTAKSDSKTDKIKTSKKSNPMKVTVKAKTVSLKKVKKANQTIAPITVKKAQGKVSYKKLSGSKKLALKSNGKIVVKKGTKKGTYKTKIKVTAKGNSKYKSASKTVTVKIKVK